MENLDKSVILTAGSEISGILLKVREKTLLGKSDLKLLIVNY